MSDKISAIKCTSCAAPLDILGGGRVSTMTCEYCHSVLDLNDNYAVLSKFNKIKRPLAPFEIGMRGNIKGVEWTIIGWITYRTIEFPSEEWNEFFLYSPTHGYAWLVYEDGIVSFSMKVRDFDLMAWQEKKSKMLFYKKGHYASEGESYMAYVDFVEGSLNWIAKFGDKFTCWDYKGVRYQSLSIEKTINEIEVFHTQKLNKKDIYHAFSLDYTKASQTQRNAKSPLDDTEEINEKSREFTKIFLIFPLLIAILIIASNFYDKSVLKTSYNKNNSEILFKIDSSAFLTSLELSASDLSTANHKISIYKKEKRIFYIDKTKVLYTEKNIKNTWKSHAIKMTAYLNLDKGIYKFVGKKDTNTSKVSIDIKQQVIRNTYLIPMLIILLLVLVMPYFSQSNFIKFLIVTIPTIIGYMIFGFPILLIFGIFALHYYFSKKDKE